MNWLFKKQDEKEQQRQNNRELRSANRQLNLDRQQLDRSEKELENEIRKLAKSGQREACTILARELVQLRKQRLKNVNTGAMITAAQSKHRQVTSMGAMTRAMASTSKTMSQVNAQLPVSEIAKRMDDFTKQNMIMDMREEVIGETLDSMLDDDTEEEENRIISQVLDEIGIDMSAKLPSAVKDDSISVSTRSSAIKAKQPTAVGSSKNTKLASASGNQSAADDYEVQKLLAELGADVGR